MNNLPDHHPRRRSTPTRLARVAAIRLSATRTTALVVTVGRAKTGLELTFTTAAGA